MNKSRRSPHILVFAITMLATLPSPTPIQQVRVLISGGFSAAYQELLPEFEKSSGTTVVTAWEPLRAVDPAGLPPSALSFAAVSPPTWSFCREKGSTSYQPKVESLKVQTSISPAFCSELACVPGHAVRTSAR